MMKIKLGENVKTGNSNYGDDCDFDVIMIMMIMRTIRVMILVMKNIKDNAKTIIMVNNHKHVYKIDLKQYKNHKTCVKVGKKQEKNTQINVG